MVRCGNGPSVELFEYTAPDQDRSFRKNSDLGGKHIAFYVRRIDKAVAERDDLLARAAALLEADRDAQPQGRESRKPDERVELLHAPEGAHQRQAHVKGAKHEA